MAFGFSLPKPPRLALGGGPSSGSSLSLADKLMMFGAIAKGHPDLAMQIPLLAEARDHARQQEAATSDLARVTSGVPIPSRAEMAAKIDPANALPPEPTEASPAPPLIDKASDPYGLASSVSGMSIPPRKLAPITTYVPPRDPSADVGGGPITLRNALPFLAKAAQRGVNIEPWTKLIEGAQPKSVVVNGRVLDEHDPSIYGGYYGDAPAKGAEPVYDRQGKQVGWHMANGAIQAIEAEAKAQSGGTEAGKLPYAEASAAATSAGSEKGKAPYTLITKDVGGVPTTMTTQQALDLANGSAAGGSAPAAGTTRLDPQAFYKGFVLKHEGGLNPSDLNGAPTMYGFNQTANPDIDVKTLTPDTAAQRFSERYFAKSGASELPAPLAAVHADTYFINPKKAQAILQQSGGDPGRYMDLREAWLSNLVKTQSGAAKYAKAWANRNADLRAVADQLAGSPTQAAPPTATSAPPIPGFHGLNPADQKTVDEAKADALGAEDVARMGHQFQGLNKGQATGPGFRPLHIPIPFLDKLDLNVPGALARQYQGGVPAMENLSMRLATGIRAPGQRLTQAEIMKNLESVPNLRNTPTQNDVAVGGYDERAATKRAYANFVSDWLSQHGSLSGADQAWAQRQSGSRGVAVSPRAISPPMKGQPMQQIKLKSGGTATVVPVG